MAYPTILYLFNECLEGNLLQLTQTTKSKGKENKADAKQDDIALSTNEDMFAFSQIIAGGGKVAQVTKAMEDEQK